MSLSIRNWPAALLTMLAPIPGFAETPLQQPASQEDDGQRRARPANSAPNFSFFSPAFELRYATAANIKNAPGRYSTTLYDTDLSFFKITPKESIVAFCGYSFTDTRFSDTPAAYGDLERVHFFARYEHRISDSQWALFVDGSFILAAEESASLGKGLIGRGGLGLKYTFSENFDFSVGVMVMNRLSDSADILPYGGFNWKISQYWSLRLTNGLVLSHDVFGDKTLRIDLAGLYRGGDYRMADITVAGRRHARALEVREFVLALSVTKEFFDRACYLGLGVEGVFLGKYKFRSTGGSNIGEFECDPSLAFALKGGFRF
ncbi:MAG: hypothetical protein LBD01_06445 [Puniceicoccales bacterium]|jgi:hypothetical protein|nr:hypothetical protein [Puniceicoccales bacterium]